MKQAGWVLEGMERRVRLIEKFYALLESGGPSEAELVGGRGKKNSTLSGSLLSKIPVVGRACRSRASEASSIESSVTVSASATATLTASATASLSVGVTVQLQNQIESPKKIQKNLTRNEWVGEPDRLRGIALEWDQAWTSYFQEGIQAQKIQKQQNQNLKKQTDTSKTPAETSETLEFRFQSQFDIVSVISPADTLRLFVLLFGILENDQLQVTNWSQPDAGGSSAAKQTATLEAVGAPSEAPACSVGGCGNQSCVNANCRNDGKDRSLTNGPTSRDPNTSGGPSAARTSPIADSVIRRSNAEVLRGRLLSSFSSWVNTIVANRNQGALSRLFAGADDTTGGFLGGLGDSAPLSQSQTQSTLENLFHHAILSKPKVLPQRTAGGGVKLYSDVQGCQGQQIVQKEGEFKEEWLESWQQAVENKRMEILLDSQAAIDIFNQISERDPIYWEETDSTRNSMRKKRPQKGATRFCGTGGHHHGSVGVVGPTALLLEQGQAVQEQALSENPCYPWTYEGQKLTSPIRVRGNSLTNSHRDHARRDQILRKLPSEKIVELLSTSLTSALQTTSIGDISFRVRNGEYKHKLLRMIEYISRHASNSFLKSNDSCLNESLKLAGNAKEDPAKQAAIPDGQQQNLSMTDRFLSSAESVKIFTQTLVSSAFQTTKSGLSQIAKRSTASVRRKYGEYLRSYVAAGGGIGCFAS